MIQPRQFICSNKNITEFHLTTTLLFSGEAIQRPLSPWKSVLVVSESWPPPPQIIIVSKVKAVIMRTSIWGEGDLDCWESKCFANSFEHTLHLALSSEMC